MHSTYVCKRQSFALGLTLSFILVHTILRAQTADGNSGINQANTMIRSYYASAVDLMYGVGALCAIIGAINVYVHWGKRDAEANRLTAAWFGGCVFLVVVSTVIKSFFGI